jgi:hypothetical protein
MVVTGQSQGQDLKPVDLQEQIVPIFQKACFDCHGTNSREGGLRLTSRREALTESDSGRPAIVPGQPLSSELLRRVESREESIQMPPHGPRLNPTEVELLKRWIANGAIWPESNVLATNHWAYIAPSRPNVPEDDPSGWSRNPIDRFIFRRLAEHGYHPSAEESPAKLLRRVSLMLTGLPPTPEQVDRFLADPSDAAYESFVDRCLASPAYGERWAQPWLDLARYADSNGFQADQLRESWAYRDWVIAAMNADLPFDQFAIEQLAGDLLPDATLDQKIATGFHRTVPCNVEAGVHPEENRINQIFDRVNTTSTVFLGTTMECCQCHNHKYDPFTQDDYYRLFAYFNNTPLEVKLDSGVQYNFDGPKLDLPLLPADQAKKEQWEAELESLLQERDQLDASVSSSTETTRTQLSKIARTPVAWETMQVEKFTSTGGESATILDDESILVGGSLPKTSVYKVVARSSLPRITAFRLEALTDERLPGTGPGRGDEKRANFILSEFSVRTVTENGPPGPRLKFELATADFSQNGWDVTNSIDGDRGTGWAIAPQFSQSHEAVFQLAKHNDPSSATGHFEFVLDQNYGRGRTLGRIRLAATDADPRALAMPASIRTLLLKKALNQKQQKELDRFMDSLDPVRTQLNRDIESLRKQLDGLQTPTTLVMVEMDTKRDTFKLIRGDYQNIGKQVSAGIPSVLHPFRSSWPENRLGLAQWIVDPANSLTARVVVNRWWAQLYGRGLVASAEDFGTQSDPPTHPELLDWLATEFVETGWSRKKIHKLIVMSASFRQTARITPERLSQDPENKLYTRGPRFRMPAETIRDNGLAVSGLLSKKMGGPPVMPFQPANIWRAVGRNAPKWRASTTEDRYRRGVYVVWRRAAPYPSFVNFDAPDRAACVVERPRTNTPLQALTLLNDQAYLEMAAALAQTVVENYPDSNPEIQIAAAMRRCIARIPSRDEVDTLMELYRSQRSRFAAEPSLAERFLQPLLLNRPEQPATAELAALTIIGNVLLNLDETINY